jgi:hypothetical protein
LAEELSGRIVAIRQDSRMGAAFLKTFKNIAANIAVLDSLTAKFNGGCDYNWNVTLAFEIA